MKHLSDTIRFLLTFLSFPHNLRRESLTKNQLDLIKLLKQKLSDLNKVNNNLKLKTHQNFSNSIMLLIQNGKLANFLRFGFIQKMFFVHNRFYNFKFLQKILRSKKDIWIKLLDESKVGNPVPFFSNKRTSGNRIRHVFLAKKIFDYGEIEDLDNVIEIGGGYGCMASIFNKINKNIEYNIFDLPEVNLLAYYYLKSQNIDCSLDNTISKINLFSDIELIKKKFYMYKNQNKNTLLIANWSLSEMPLVLREQIEFLFTGCSYAIISYQSNFEKISNVQYFEKLQKKLSHSHISKIHNLNEMNGNFSSNKHYTLMIKKKQ